MTRGRRKAASRVGSLETSPYAVTVSQVFSDLYAAPFVTSAAVLRLIAYVLNE